MKQFQLSNLALTLAGVGLLLLQSNARAGGEGFSESSDGKSSIDTKSSLSTSDVGLGKFSTNPFHVSVTVRGGYDDNVNLSPTDERSSPFSNIGVGLTYEFGSPRTRMSLNAGVSATYYWENSGDQFGNNSDDWSLNAWVAFSIVHKATPRLTLSAQVNAAYISTPGFDTFNNALLVSEARNQNFFETVNKFSVAYQWAPRFSTVSSYTLSYIKYDDATIGFFEDRYEHTLGNEFRFLLSPTTTLVGEYRFGLVDYLDENNRDSYSNFFLAGVDHTFSPRFNVSFRGGVEVRHFDENPNLVFGNVSDTQTAPYGEFTLNYALGQGTSISWFNRYAFEQPNVPDALVRQTYRTTLSIRHAFTARISSGVNFSYAHDSYDATFAEPSFDEDSFDINLFARYSINRTWSVDVGYDHTEVISPPAFFRDFTRNQYYAGVTFTW
ncbi:MAG TPA: outer membrane beta-barrel protein [Chthoniobacterales bacterium]